MWIGPDDVIITDIILPPDGIYTYSVGYTGHGGNMIMDKEYTRPVRYKSHEAAREIVRELWPWLDKAEIDLIAHILVEAYVRR